jgi:hypothetical protein
MEDKKSQIIKVSPYWQDELREIWLANHIPDVKQREFEGHGNWRGDY